MEVGKPSIPQSSAWATPLSLDPDPGMPLPKPAPRPPSPSITIPTAHPDSSALPSRPPPRIPHSLVRSESAPLNLLDDLQQDVAALSLDDSRPMNFAAAAAASPQGQRRPPPPSNKPPPSRSLSSVELAGIVNAGAAPGVTAVPPRIPTSAPSAAARSTSRPVPAMSSAGKEASVPAWHKSVFDMIQDDFPRTPAPMLSSLNPARNHDFHSGPDYRAVANDRRSRLSSTASLDLDLDRLGTVADPANELTRSRKEAGSVPAAPPTRTHRRSVSINWTGDIGGGLRTEMTREMSRSSSRSNLPSSPQSSAYFSGKHLDMPPLAQAPVRSATPSSAMDLSGPTSPEQSLSPTGSGAPSAIASSPVQSSGSLKPITGPGGLNLPQSASSQQMASYGLPGSRSGTVLSAPVENLSVPGLNEYEYLYDHQDSIIGSSASNMQLPPITNHGYSMSQAGMLGSGPGGTMPPLGRASQYGNVFPGTGLFPSPFSNTSGGIGNGVGPVYTDTFRDGLAAADNLKNMSLQMAAFLNAQQQLYAAQMAQMAAITGSTGFGNPAAFAGLQAGLGHVGNGSQTGPLRSPWEARDPGLVPQRSVPRSKHHFDQSRNGSGHMGGHKKVSPLDINHKSRAGRGRRGHRGHDELGLMNGPKVDRTGGGSGVLVGGVQDSGHARSPLLEEFRATSLSIGRTIGSVGDLGVTGGYGPGGVCQVPNGREWQLSEIKDNVVEFATDQHGSRFIQQKLESASAEEKEAILRHALTDAQRLMTDVFGNYVVQKLLDHGGETAVKLIARELEGRMLVLSLHMYGCRVVQKALEVLEPASRAALVRELDGHVLKCIRDQNGNHVIQKCVELVEPKSVQFIVDSVQGQAVVLAGHSYGCRVVQRCLEYGTSKQKAPIMIEIMACIADLIKDQYGNYVIQHVVEHGTVEERSIIMNLVRGEVCQLSQHKFASNVVERCLQFGSLEERQILIEILSGGAGASATSPLNHLVRDQFGNYVVQRVLDVALPPQRERVVTILRAQVPAIKKYSYGKHIIARLEDHPASSGAYRHNTGSHSHGGNGQGLRHVNSSMMSRSATNGLSQAPTDYLFYG